MATGGNGNGKMAIIIVSAAATVVNGLAAALLGLVIQRIDSVESFGQYRADGADRRIEQLDEALQREMRLISGQVEERVLALKGELERLITASRDLREEQIGELKRRLESIEMPTNSSRNGELDELRRRIELLEKRPP